jgi:hypothetical protein
VLAASSRYEGPTRAARLGFFLRRDELPGLETFALRASAEAETDFAPPLRGAVGLGLEHVPTGIATLLQGSRTLLRDEARPAADVDTRGGVFVVGTIEPPTSIFVGGMKTRARLVHEEWQEIAAIEARVAAAEAKLQRLGRRDVSGAEAAGALEALARARASLDEHLARLTARVAEYLESRRRVYALLHWARPADDLYGPLDPAILAGVRARVVTRLEELAAGLRPVPGRLARLRRRHQHVRDALTALERDGAAAGPAGRAYAVERAALEATWRREAEAAGTLLDAYLDQRDGVRRIAEASRRAVAWREAEPLELQVIRAVAAVGPTP